MKNISNSEVSTRLSSLFFKTFKNYRTIPDTIQNMIDVSIAYIRNKQEPLYFDDITATSPLLELLNKIQKGNDIIISFTDGANIQLTRGAKTILSECITSWFDNLLKPLSLQKDEQDEVDFYLNWPGNIEATKEKINDMYKRKHQNIKQEQEAGRFLSMWEDAIPWEDSQTLSERMLFLYKIGEIIGIYSLLTAQYLSDKECSDKAYSDIQSFKNIQFNQA